MRAEGTNTRESGTAVLSAGCAGINIASLDEMLVPVS